MPQKPTYPGFTPDDEPDLSGFTPDEPTQKEPESFLQSYAPESLKPFVGWAERPIWSLPTRIGQAIGEPMMKYGEAKDTPDWMRTPALAAGAWTKQVGEGVSGLTSPLNIAAMGSLEGASALSNAGKAMPVAKGLAATGKALTAPMIAEGAHQVYTGKTWDEKLAGIPGMVLGYYGLREPFPTGRTVPRDPHAPIDTSAWDTGTHTDQPPPPPAPPNQPPPNGPRATAEPVPEAINPLLDRLRTSLEADKARKSQVPPTETPVPSGRLTAQDYPEGQNPLFAEHYARQQQTTPDLPPAEPNFVQQVDPSTDIFANNASGESAASQEAMNRQQSMQTQGQQFAVIDRAGNMRPLIGPEAVDYNPQPGETYGIMRPEGFQVLTDNGGRYGMKAESPQLGAESPSITQPDTYDLGDISQFSEQVAPSEDILAQPTKQPPVTSLQPEIPPGQVTNADMISRSNEIAREGQVSPEPQYTGGHEFQPDIPTTEETVAGGTSPIQLDPNAPLEIRAGRNGEAVLPNPTPENIARMEQEGYVRGETLPDGSVTMRRQTPREQVTTNPQKRQSWSEAIRAFLKDESGEFNLDRSVQDNPIEHDEGHQGLQFHFRREGQFVTHREIPGEILGPYPMTEEGNAAIVNDGVELQRRAFEARNSAPSPVSSPVGPERYATYPRLEDLPVGHSEFADRPQYHIRREGVYVTRPRGEQTGPFPSMRTALDSTRAERRAIDAARNQPRTEPESLDAIFSSPEMQQPIRTTPERDIRYDVETGTFFDRNHPNWADVEDATQAEINRAQGISEGTIPDPTANPRGWQSVETSTPDSPSMESASSSYEPYVPKFSEPKARKRAPRRETLEKLFGKELLDDLEKNPIRHSKKPYGTNAREGRSERKVSREEVRTWENFANEQVKQHVEPDPSKPGLSVINPYSYSPEAFEIHYRSKDGTPQGIIVSNYDGTGISTLGVRNDVSGLARGRILARMFSEAAKRGVRSASSSTSALTDNILQQIMRGLKNVAKNEEGHFDIDALTNFFRRFFGRSEGETGVGEETDINVARERLERETGRPIVLEQDVPTRGPRGQGQTQEIGKVRQYFDLARGLMSVDPPWVTSAAFRQALPWAGTRNWWKAWGKAAEHFQSKESYDAFMANVMDSPLFRPRQNPATGRPDISFAQEIGLRMTDVNMARSARQEGIRSQLAEKIPIWGKYVAASNRAFSGFLNYLRFSQLEAMVRDGQVMARAHNDPTLDLTRNIPLAKEMAGMLNDTTGSGKLETGIGKLQYNAEKHASALADVFFSPRLMASRIRMLNPSTYIMASKPVRQQYLHAMMRSVAMWWGIAQMGKLIGGEVSTDPKNPDFGKIKIGDTRLDPGGGFQQWLVLGARNATGQYTSSTTGNTGTFGQGYNAPTRTSNNIDFMANKLHPVAKLIWDLGAANERQPVYVADRVAQLFLPMISGDLLELAQKDPSLIPLVGAFSATGGGSQTYTGEPTEPSIIPENVPGNFKWTGGSLWPNED